MKYRKLRIAWSVVWGVGVLLLIWLWVRSYWWIDGASGSWGRDYIYAATRPAAVRIAYMIPRSPVAVNWTAFSEPARLQTDVLSWNSATNKRVPGLRWWRSGDDWQIEIRFWLITLLALLMTPLAWTGFSKRFSLRTLLIGMTVIAVALGLVIWAANE